MADDGEGIERRDRAGWAHTGRIDFSRLDWPTRILGLSTVALFVSLELPWYTVSVGPGAKAVTGSANAMVSGGWRWAMWLVALATIVYVFLESVTSWRKPAWLHRYEALVTVAVVEVALVLLGVLAYKAVPPLPTTTTAALGSVDVGFGAWISLGLAMVALGAATAGRDESGTPRLDGVRVRSPVVGLRSPIYRVAPDPSAPDPSVAVPLTDDDALPVPEGEDPLLLLAADFTFVVPVDAVDAVDAVGEVVEVPAVGEVRVIGEVPAVGEVGVVGQVGEGAEAGPIDLGEPGAVYGPSGPPAGKSTRRRLRSAAASDAVQSDVPQQPSQHEE